MDGASGGPNWLGLLQWSLAHCDGTAPSAATSMSEEDKEWLTNVLKESTKNEADRLKEIYIDIMKVVDDKSIAGAPAGAETETESKVDAFLDELEELRDIVEQIDMAQVFAKFGGVVCLARLFDIDTASVPMEVKTTAASIIGTLSQNNPAVQQIMLEQNTVSLLVQKFLECVRPTTDGAAPAYKLAEKMTYAISCSVRNHFPSETLFISTHANEFLLAALETQHVPLVTRVFFLAQALISSDNASLAQVHALCVPIMPVLLPYFAKTAATGDAEGAEGAEGGGSTQYSVQLREVTTQLLLAILHTEMGWQQFGVGMPCHADFKQALAVLQSAAASSSSEDAEYSGRLLADVVLASERKNVLHPKPVPVAPPAAAPAAAAVEPVLMIAPPALEVASNIS